MFLIPTRYKSNLPGHLTYPVGAEALSNALEGLPHVEKFSIFFSASPTISASEFQRILVQGRPYGVLRAEYRRPEKPGISGSNDDVEKGWYAESWGLMVFPVLRKLRSLVRPLLLAEGMPAVAGWLRSSGQAGWEMRTRWVDLIFDPSSGAITTREGSRP
jgi:hypothetical protein